MKRLDVATIYHRLGFNVVPTSEDKRATGKWKTWSEERQSEEALRALGWERDGVCGLAAIAGYVSGHLVALDLDGAPGVNVLEGLLARLGLPRDYAWAVRTPGKGGGWHVWVRSPGLAEALTRANLKLVSKHEGPWSGADHIELRWMGCYTLLPPSRHPDGRYEWANGATAIPSEPPTEVEPRKLVRLTEWEKGERKEEAKASMVAGADYSAYVAKALEGEADALRNATLHHRNTQLNKSAFAMGTLAHAGAEKDVVAGVLIPVARDIGLTETEIRSTFASGWDDGVLEPRVLPEPRQKAKPEPKTQPDPEKTPETAEEPTQTEAQPAQPATSNLLAIIKATTRYKTEPMEPGIDYPWSTVNRLTRGLRKGWLCYLAGYPGSGKTAAALEIIFSAAKQRKRVLLNSLEMNEEEIALRFIQRWGLDTGHLFAGQLNPDDIMAFDNAAHFAAYGNVEVATEHRLDKLERMVADWQPDLLVIDYLGLMDMGRDNALEGTTKLSRGLKAMARNHRLPIVCLSQLTRPQDRQRVTVPTMHDLRNSGQLEGDADQIIFVFREQDQDSKTVKSEGRFIVAKARFGRPGKSDFVFNGERQVFEKPPAARAQEQGWSVYDGGRI